MCEFLHLQRGSKNTQVISPESLREETITKENHLSPQKQDSKSSQSIAAVQLKNHNNLKAILEAGGSITTTSVRNTIESEESHSPGLRFPRKNRLMAPIAVDK